MRVFLSGDNELRQSNKSRSQCVIWEWGCREEKNWRIYTTHVSIVAGRCRVFPILYQQVGFVFWRVNRRKAVCCSLDCQLAQLGTHNTITLISTFSIIEDFVIVFSHEHFQFAGKRESLSYRCWLRRLVESPHTQQAALMTITMQQWCDLTSRIQKLSSSAVNFALFGQQQ